MPVVTQKVAEMSVKTFYAILGIWLAVQLSVSGFLWVAMGNKVDRNDFDKFVTRIESRGQRTLLDMKLLAATDARLSTAVAVLTNNQTNLTSMLALLRDDLRRHRQELTSSIDRMERAINSLVQRLKK